MSQAEQQFKEKAAAAAIDQRLARMEKKMQDYQRMALPAAGFAIGLAFIAVLQNRRQDKNLLRMANNQASLAQNQISLANTISSLTGLPQHH